MASKSSDVRPKITLACTECKERNYITKKNRRNDPDRIELKKFCPRYRRHTSTARPADVVPRRTDPSESPRTGRRGSRTPCELLPARVVTCPSTPRWWGARSPHRRPCP